MGAAGMLGVVSSVITVWSRGFFNLSTKSEMHKPAFSAGLFF
jgi:hypothetical protein